LNIASEFSREQSNNICGTLIGSKYPEDVIIIGNHRNSWDKELLDGGSGLATMLELIRMLSKDL
jgi:Zn-dependent M28 family amino/carboxypeptidase